MGSSRPAPTRCGSTNRTAGWPSALVAGAAPRTIRVTIPEGFSLAQTAALLRSRIPGFSAAQYLDLTARHPVTIDVPGYKPGTTLQGLLFPATYNVLPTVTARQFIALQIAALKNNLAEVDMRRAAKANLTPYDVVTIASLIEREARASGDRARIAAVIWNRLRLGMRLQIDATVLYALGRHKDQLSYHDLTVASPYNTYLHFGLPPTPIDNPGLASLTAAANPVHAALSLLRRARRRHRSALLLEHLRAVPEGPHASGIEAGEPRPPARTGRRAAACLATRLAPAAPVALTEEQQHQAHHRPARPPVVDGAEVRQQKAASEQAAPAVLRPLPARLVRATSQSCHANPPR